MKKLFCFFTTFLRTCPARRRSTLEAWLWSRRNPSVCSGCPVRIRVFAEKTQKTTFLATCSTQPVLFRISVDTNTCCDNCFKPVELTPTRLFHYLKNDKHLVPRPPRPLLHGSHPALVHHVLLAPQDLALNVGKLQLLLLLLWRIWRNQLLLLLRWLLPQWGQLLLLLLPPWPQWRWRRRHFSALLLVRKSLLLLLMKRVVSFVRSVNLPLRSERSRRSLPECHAFVKFP